MKNRKYIFVLGGVLSGIGKGICAASIGRLLRAHGYSVNIKKLDGYLNFDPGTLNPYEHGEVFVTKDGAETDLDLGHYERFIDIDLNGGSSITSGKIYKSILEKERTGFYLGNTVQVIPHVTNEIKERIYGDNGDVDFVIVEIGGTVGDIENQAFIEASRQIRKEVGVNNSLFVLVALIPFLSASGEIKTKPTQHSVKELRSVGIQPDVLVCRTDQEISKKAREKLSLFCDVTLDAVIENRTAKTIYEVPLALQKDGIDKVILNKLMLPYSEVDMTGWRDFVNEIKVLRPSVNIALVGKYVQLHDAYMSVVEALNHAGVENSVNVHIKWINAEEINIQDLQDVDGILVPGGFGNRGIEGKISAIHFARENNIPFLGLCLGLQCATIEFARNVCGLTEANSMEFNSDSENLVVTLMDSQHNVVSMGGTMRLGSYPCCLVPGTTAYEAYGNKDRISERHRHRFEFNSEYREVFEKEGLTVSGLSPDGGLVEIIELKEHPFFVAVQFHPEFESRPNRPHPLFAKFIKTVKELKNGEKINS